MKSDRYDTCQRERLCPEYLEWTVPFLSEGTNVQILYIVIWFYIKTDFA